MESSSTKKLPLIIRKNKISLLKKDSFTSDTGLLRCMKVTRPFFVKEDVIYRSEPRDFMKGEYPNLTIINRLNILANSSRTTAKYCDAALGSIERTSDEVAKLIGQKNYDIVFSALCSVISQELRIQGILALLTIQKNTTSNSCQTDDIDSGKDLSPTKVNLIDASSQTDETCYDLLHRLKSRKKIKRPHSTPYVVVKDTKSDNIKKLVIEPQHFEITKKLLKLEEEVLNSENNQTKKINKDSNRFLDNFKYIENNTQSDCSVSQFVDHSMLKESVIKSEKSETKETSLPEIKEIVDEDSNISDISCGNISIISSNIPLIVENPDALFNNIDKHTEEPSSLYPLTLPDGSQVKIRGKPEDQFHIATAEILKYLNPVEQSKVMWYQAYIDFKFCLQRDEDDNLPIHLAVLNNDIDLLRRQCVVLKSRQETVDIPAHSNLTALQISIFQESAACTAVLLHHGANPLTTDEEQRTAFHLAAEVTPDHLRAVVDHCQKNARYILHDNDMWKQELEEKSDKEIASYLLTKVCRMYDNQGYTPLISASKMGNYTNVKVLLDADPNSVNLPMPNCGNTALYSAVSAACIDAENSNNKSKAADHFLKTVEVLVKHGADPSIENNSGNSVNLLLNEFRLTEMSMIIANTIVACKYPEKERDILKDFSAFMLVKEDSGVVNLKELKPDKKKETVKTPSKLIITPTPIAKPPVSSGVTVLATNNKSPSEIIIYANKSIKAESSSTEKPLPKPAPIQSIMFLPIVSKTAMKNVSLNKNVASCAKTNVIRTAPKMVTVAKLDLNTKVNLVNVPAKTTSTATLSTNTTTIKNIVKRKTESVGKTPRNQTRDVPIKKQKRDLNQ